MDARHAQTRQFVPLADWRCLKGDFPARFHDIWGQIFGKPSYLSCGFRRLAIVVNGTSLIGVGTGIRSTDTSVGLIEKEKARVFADRRAFPEIGTAAGPVVIRDYPSRKKDPSPAVTPQTVPLTAPRLVNQEQAVQMFGPTASSGRPHCRVGRSGAPGSAPGIPRDLDRRIKSGFAVSRRTSTQACRSRRPCLTAEAAYGAEHPCPRSPRRRT